MLGTGVLAGSLQAGSRAASRSLRLPDASQAVGLRQEVEPARVIHPRDFKSHLPQNVTTRANDNNNRPKCLELSNLLLRIVPYRHFLYPSVPISCQRTTKQKSFAI